MELKGSVPKNQRILEAAEQIFSKRGFEKATLDEIIALADVGKGTVYKYFGNKERLFYEIVSKKNESFIERLQQALLVGKDFREKMYLFFVEMISFYKKYSALWQIICFEMLSNNTGYMVHTVNGEYIVSSRYENEISDDVKERMIRYHVLLESEFNLLMDLFDDAAAAGVLKPGNAEIRTMFVFFGVAMCIFHPHEEVELLPSEEMASLTVERFLDGECC